MSHHSSRGRVSRQEHEYRAPPTDEQQERIVDLTGQGFTDPEIAAWLHLTVYQVAHVRHKNGLHKEQSGGRHPQIISRICRPAHVLGEAGDDIWFYTCDRAFQEAVNDALDTGGW